MLIIQFVVVLLLLLFFQFCPENVVVRNRVWSCWLDLAENSTYLLFVLVSTLATVTSPGCVCKEEQTSQCKSSNARWFQQDDRRRRSLPITAGLICLARGSCGHSLSERSVVSIVCKQVSPPLMLVRVWKIIEIDLSRNDGFFCFGLSGSKKFSSQKAFVSF
jgi:hypothetical protein